MQAMIYHDIGYNIIHVTNHIFLTYRNIVLELRVFVLPSTKATKIFKFIHTYKKKARSLIQDNGYTNNSEFLL